MTFKTPLIFTACLLLASVFSAPLVSCSDDNNKVMDDSNTDIDANADANADADADADTVADTETNEDKAEETTPEFPGIAVVGDLIETESGLKYYDIVVGEGAQPAGPTSRVKVHYTGYLVDGTKFDSSVDRGQPSTFSLNRVISGWTEGVGSMKVGGKRKLIIPYALAYGENGGRGIPPKATLIFDIELLEIVSE
ncbi:MAG: FKBP-type peptidyl-prolyl cis-trans isomerase [Planctomycetes bacterium]|nr:FKBP-type peptidyl-prolyl cis-trans isomerase [Planctomycetota bacterium]